MTYYDAPPDWESTVFGMGQLPESYEAQYMTQPQPDPFSNRQQWIDQAMMFANAPTQDLFAGWGGFEQAPKYWYDDQSKLAGQQLTQGRYATDAAIDAQMAEQRMGMQDVAMQGDVLEQQAQYSSGDADLDLLMAMNPEAYSPSNMATLFDPDLTPEQREEILNGIGEQLQLMDPDTGMLNIKLPGNWARIQRMVQAAQGREQQVMDEEQAVLGEARQQRFSGLAPEQRKREVWLNQQYGRPFAATRSGRVYQGDQAETMANMEEQLSRGGRPQRWGWDPKTGKVTTGGSANRRSYFDKESGRHYYGSKQAQPQRSVVNTGLRGPGEEPWRPATDPRWSDRQPQPTDKVVKPPINPNNMNVRWDETRRAWVAI